MTVTRQIPTADDFIQAALTKLRAPLREKFYSTAAGNTRVKTAGERVILGPDGTPIRVLEDPSGGTQIEQGDHLHAVVRPRTTTISLKAGY